jgi:hypothetical protein
MNLPRVVLLLIIMGCGTVALQPGPSSASASRTGPEYTADASGRKYYVLAFNVSTMALEQFNWMFADNVTDNATSAGADNETATGLVTIEQAGKTFIEARGTYLATGDAYNGSWEGTEKNYSAYYEADIYTYYSFLFYGIGLIENTFTSGIIYSTTREESKAKEPKEYTSVMPYIGFLVAASVDVLQ